MSDPLHHIIPIPQSDVAEVFTVYQTTHQFYHEVRSREEWEQHCLWYAQVAAEHQRDFEKMQSEPSIIGWFYDWRNR